MSTELPAFFDVAVVGGSYAGLSAALQIARTRRPVLVVDAGRRRNRFASAAHGFLGQDGRDPAAIIDDARRQVLAYPNARWLDDTVEHAQGAFDDFELATASGRRLRARRLVLATGAVDELPQVEGLAERWGRSVFHCPYCHGYELDSGRIGVLAGGEASLHHALMLPDWGRVTLFADGRIEPDHAQRTALDARGVTVETARVRRIVDLATVELDDGRRIEMDGVFALTRTRMASSVGEQLGCEIDSGPFGDCLRADALRQTTVTGVFACGDAARAFGNIPLAVGDGALAGVAAHRSLLFD